MKIIDVATLDMPELDIFTRLNERQVKKIYEPGPGAFICESAKVIQRAIDAGYKIISAFVENSKLSLALDLFSGQDIPVYSAEYEIMKKLTGYSLTGGILAAMQRNEPGRAEDILKDSNKVVLLDDIENPTNIGAIFRSAAALGADAVLLTEGCADPLYRRASRVSMGSVFCVKWTYADKNIMSLLKEYGFRTYALALKDDAIKLNDCVGLDDKRAVILGNEEKGISENILKDSDNCVIIPMDNGVDSLNVAAASAVAFWEIFNSVGEIPHL